MDSTRQQEEGFEACHICGDDLTMENTRVQIDDSSPTCVGCVSKLILRVISGEDEYPVKVNGSEFKPSDFSHILDQDQVKQYEEFGYEHQTPPADRIYCTCGTFIGRRIETPEPHQHAYYLSRCKDLGCHLSYCKVCATRVNESNPLENHDCAAKVQALKDDRQRIMDSNERGREYQVCPKCARLVYSISDCNHITCPCKEEFCYVCGQSHKDDGHWGVGEGRCPMFPTTLRDPPNPPPLFAAPDPFAHILRDTEGLYPPYQEPLDLGIDFMDEGPEAPRQAPPFADLDAGDWFITLHHPEATGEPRIDRHLGARGGIFEFTVRAEPQLQIGNTDDLALTRTHMGNHLPRLDATERSARQRAERAARAARRAARRDRLPRQ